MIVRNLHSRKQKPAKLNETVTILTYILEVSSFNLGRVHAMSGIRIRSFPQSLQLNAYKTKLHGLSPRENYTDRAITACRRS
jgi:hypothetical protein